MNKRTGKRVMLINVTCGSGSTGRIVTGIYDELTAHGYVCQIGYGRGKHPKGYDAFRIGNPLDMYAHGGLSRMTDRQGFYSSQCTRRLIRKIKKFRPDIIHLHNLHGYYLNVDILFRFLKKSGIYVIWTLHDCWSFTGHCTHFEYFGCNKWLTQCSKCDQLREYPKCYLMDQSKRNYKQKMKLFAEMPRMSIVTPSNWLKSKVEQSYMGDYPITVVPTGIDLKAFRPREISLKEKYGLQKKFVVLGVANPWRDRKGLGEFQKLEHIINDRYKIVLLGLKPKQIKALQKTSPNILGLPRTESLEEMAAWYSTADAFVNLTLEDTFPTTNLEALACGTPVVTYKAGGSPESIDSTCGYAVHKSSLSGVIAALDMIRTGEDKKKACRDHAKQYSMEKRYRQYYEDVYLPLEEVLDQIKGERIDAYNKKKKGSVDEKAEYLEFYVERYEDYKGKPGTFEDDEYADDEYTDDEYDEYSDDEYMDDEYDESPDDEYEDDEYDEYADDESADDEDAGDESAEKDDEDDDEFAADYVGTEIKNGTSIDPETDPFAKSRVERRRREREAQMEKAEVDGYEKPSARRKREAEELEEDEEDDEDDFLIDLNI